MYQLKLIYDHKTDYGYTNTLTLTLVFDFRSEMLNFAEIALRHHAEEKMKVEISLIEKGENNESEVNENPDKTESTEESV